MKKQWLKAGVYVLKANWSMADILKELTEGEPLDFFVNVIPGETSYAVGQKLNEASNLSGDPVAVAPEGSLLAIRYDFMPGDPRDTARQDAGRDEGQAAGDLGQSRHLDRRRDQVAEELVTLASIVEKETGLETERPQVASVFINRLRKKMPLQTDPTVLYGVTEGKVVLDRSPTSAELKQKNAYNTYLNPGLPRGLIANPGEEALLAVAHPAVTKDLYFVAKSSQPGRRAPVRCDLCRPPQEREALPQGGCRSRCRGGARGAGG